MCVIRQADCYSYTVTCINQVKNETNKRIKFYFLVEEPRQFTRYSLYYDDWQEDIPNGQPYILLFTQTAADYV